MGHEQGCGFVVGENRVEGWTRTHRADCEHATLGHRTTENSSLHRRSRDEPYASYGDAYSTARELQPSGKPQACPACIPPGTMSEWLPWLTADKEARTLAHARALLAEDPMC